MANEEFRSEAKPHGANFAEAPETSGRVVWRHSTAMLLKKENYLYLSLSFSYEVSWTRVKIVGLNEGPPFNE